MGFCCIILLTAYLYRGFRVVTVLRGHFRPSLIPQQQIMGSVFAIWAIIQSIQMIVFHFLSHLSGFGCHFEAFQII